MMILGWVWLRAVILGGESKIFGWRKWWFWHLFQHLFLSFFLLLLLLLFSIFGLIIYMNFYMGLMNMAVLLIFWVWYGCTVDEYGCAVDEFADVGRGQSNNCIVRTFSLHSFPPDLGGKKLVGSGGKFSSEFSVLSFFLCFLNSGKHCFPHHFPPIVFHPPYNSSNKT